MLPRRRYRLFTICAVIFVVLIYRSLNNSWALSTGATDSIHLVDSPADAPVVPPAGGGDGESKAPEDLSKPAPGLLGDEQDAEKKLQQDTKTNEKLEGDKDPLKVDTSKPDSSAQDASKDSTSNDAILKESTSPDYTGNDSEAPEIPHVHWSDPPMDNHKLDHPADEKQWASEHWIKPKENYPLPEASLIPIPTGTPKKIPTIQHEFGTESEKAKNARLYRQSRVKVELKRAWSGYRKYAWMHDELTPQTNQFKDPFCGWAATLVDSLDTLWIADMRDQFDEAATAVAKIDFTYTTRADIPVFETTIRYLGGLLAAYDVSGGPEGRYSILLTKAVELAEILMGIFDTPNRMPLLYYHWRLPYASEPHRAGTVGIAELGTLSMEFTRLAQLTGKAKYYDAVDRITDALIQMQKDGHSHIPGLFPEKIDASGCNQTATTIRDNLSAEAQKQMDSEELATPPKGFEPSLESETETDAETTLESKLESKSESKLEPKSESNLETKSESELESKSEPETKKLNARAAIPPPGPDAEKEESAEADNGPLSALGPDINEDKKKQKTNNGRQGPLKADGSEAEWECVPQGLTRAPYGGDMYHVGGSQDSAYEYFPKQYLLLGGLEPKYQKLHEDTVEAIDKHLMYRPMIKDSGDWDILFPAKLTHRSWAANEMDVSYEIAHLTCFIGGMYGLGGKIFNRPEDIETAKKLTDGCVWAYQSTTSGVMPEFAHLAPCPTLEKCKFNQTYWYELLDPSKQWREAEMEKWEKAEARRKEALKTESLSKQSEEKTKDTDSEDPKSTSSDKETTDGYQSYDSASVPESDLKAKDISDEKPSHLAKRNGIPMPELDNVLSAPKGETGSELPESLKKKLGMDHRWDDNEDAALKPDPEYIAPPPSESPNKRPMTHEEYVEKKLESTQLPPGYTDVSNYNYILRPEAIESVWYMYRITGDPEWMDKGWAMFEATIKATRTEFANSAIDNVFDTSPTINDSMESFWIAETLKYYYLLFSEPSLISLDEWVLNTEAHPFRRPTAASMEGMSSSNY